MTDSIDQSPALQSNINISINLNPLQRVLLTFVQIPNAPTTCNQQTTPPSIGGGGAGGPAGLGACASTAISSSAGRAGEEPASDFFDSGGEPIALLLSRLREPWVHLCSEIKASAEGKDVVGSKDAAVLVSVQLTLPEPRTRCPPGLFRLRADPDSHLQVKCKFGDFAGAIAEEAQRRGRRIA